MQPKQRTPIWKYLDMEIHRNPIQCIFVYLPTYVSISRYLSPSLSLCIPFLINMQVLTAILVLQPARLGPILLISASLRMLAINSWTWLSRAHIWVSHGVTMLKINSINQDLPRIWYSWTRLLLTLMVEPVSAVPITPRSLAWNPCPRGTQSCKPLLIRLIPA